MGAIIQLAIVKQKIAQKKSEQQLREKTQERLCQDMVQSDLLPPVIDAIKYRELAEEQANSLISFLSRHFNLSGKEIEIDQETKIMQSAHPRMNQAINQSPNAKAMNNAILHKIFAAAQQKVLKRETAIRLIKLTKLWYPPEKTPIKQLPGK